MQPLCLSWTYLFDLCVLSDCPADENSTLTCWLTAAACISPRWYDGHWHLSYQITSPLISSLFRCKNLFVCVCVCVCLCVCVCVCIPCFAAVPKILTINTKLFTVTNLSIFQLLSAIKYVCFLSHISLFLVQLCSPPWEPLTVVH